MKLHDITELNSLYQDAEACDSDLFAEQRSNILLVSGNHYTKRSRQLIQSLRRSDSVSKDQKIRLTKNHIHKIARTYVNNLLTHAPGVSIGPRNENELSDQKSAELNNSVWSFIREKHQLKAKMRDIAHDFIDVGEGVVKLFFDPNAGDFVGWEPKVNDMGEPVLKDNGEPDAIPIFSGDIRFERIIAFNLLRDPCAKNFDESSFLIYRKMENINELRRMYEGDEEKLALISESSKNTYQVFDHNTGTYKSSKDEVMIKEFYFRPCSNYPNGYFYIATDAGILHQGEIPLGIFPIIYVGFDQVPTYARAFSIIKQLRPFQAEINRAASKIAEHQITLGDDKMILLNGSTMTPGGVAHGIKAVKVSGQAPTVISGRNGEQFIGYMQQQIEEMYAVANVVEDSLEKNAQMDAFALLFRGIREKKKFSIYAEKWEEFYFKVCETALRLGKAYYDPARVIPYLGRNELVNIQEWKNTEPLSYQIKLEPSSDDFETKVGRTISLNHIIQYAGQNLQSGDLGKLIRAMPYVNKEELFSDLTIDYDNVTNDILAMDKGRFCPANRDDNHQYYVQRLTHRMKQSDFEFLPQQIKDMYQAKRQQHEQFIVEQEQAKQMAESGFIPTGGYLVACDLYVPDSRDPTKMPKRARIPFESIAWLLKKLETQGTTQAMIQSMPQSAVGDMARMGLGSMPMEGGPPSGDVVDVPPQQLLNQMAVNG